MTLVLDYTIVYSHAPVFNRIINCSNIKELNYIIWNSIYAETLINCYISVHYLNVYRGTHIPKLAVLHIRGGEYLISNRIFISYLYSIHTSSLDVILG
jgi:hypothetical protein